MNCCTLNTSGIDWVAILALVVAIIAVVIGIIYNRETLKLTKAHNKKSVEPLLTDLYLKNEYIGPEDKLFHSYKIKNCGPGPAIVTSIILRYNGKDYKNTKELLFEQLPINNILTSSVSYFVIKDFHIFSSNEEVVLFRANFLDLENSYKLKVLAKKISIEIKYESIYGDNKIFKKSQISSE